jgi:hypothetical protein
VHAAEPIARSPRLGRYAAAQALAGALLGVAIGFIPLAQYTCAMVLWADSPMALEKPPRDGEPSPAGLVWAPLTYRLVSAIGGMPLAGALVAYLVLVGCAAYALVRAINPTFRVTTGVDWDRFLLFRTYMHTAPLLKVVVTAVPVFVLTFGVWIAARSVAPVGEGQVALAAALFGAATWLALSRTGIVGDCDNGNYQLPTRRRATGLAVRGALYGLLVWLTFWGASGVAPPALLRMAGALGGVGEAAWRAAAVIWLGACAGGGALLGLGSVWLGRPGVTTAARGRGLAITAVSAVLFIGAVAIWVPAHARTRYDYNLQDGEPVQPNWWTADAAGGRNAGLLAVANSDGQGPAGRWRVRLVRRVGISGIALTDGNAGRLRALLGRRRHRTALSRPSATALYDRACLEMRPAERLAVALRHVRMAADARFAGVLMEDFAALAGDPDAHKLLAQLGDGRVLTYPTDDAHLPVGDLFARYGDIAGARRWYVRSGIPEQRAMERASRMAALARSEVRGSLEMHAPGWRVKVALVPAFGALAAGFANDAEGSPIEPFALREVVRVAQPDAAGRFTLGHVLEGSYRLALWLAPPGGRDLHRAEIGSLDSAGGVIRCDGYSRLDVGVVRLTARSFTR